MGNQNYREGSYRKFSYHLLVYFFHRDESSEKGDLNPTVKMNLTLFDVGHLKEHYIEFCQSNIRLNFEQLMKAVHEGDPLKYKRCMILKTINEGNLLARNAYSK